MPKYYCDYCDIFLTHDSASVRKAHNTGWKHLMQVRNYYAALGQDSAQSVIDEITKAYEMTGGMPPPVYGGFPGPGSFGAPPMHMGRPMAPPVQGGPPPFMRPPGGPGMPPFPSGPPGHYPLPPHQHPSPGQQPPLGQAPRSSGEEM